MTTKILEFSKTLVNRMTAIFAAHLLLSFAAVLFVPNLAFVVDLAGATAPIYITVFGGYFGKAAVENVKKITEKQQNG